MGVVFLVVAVLLIGGTAWLWRVSSARIVQLAMMTETEVVTSEPSSSKSLPMNEDLPERAVEDDEGEDRAPVFPAEGTVRRHMPSEWHGYQLQGGPFVPSRPFPAASAIHTLTCVGEAVVPKQVYVGDSQNVVLKVQVTSRVHGALPEQMRLSETEQGKRLHLRVQEQEHNGTWLEVELLAAGATTDGAKVQRQPLGTSALIYRWNCYFSSPGNQTVTLILRASDAFESHELGVLQQEIKVTKVAHFSQQQIELLTALSGVVSFLSTLLGIAAMLRVI